MTAIEIVFLALVGAALLVLGGAGGWLLAVRTGRRRPASEAAPEIEEPADQESLSEMLTATGAELASLAVRAGIDVGTRALIPAVRSSLASLVSWAERERPDLRRATAADGTATLMFTDIEGSTALNERLGDERWLELLAEHDRTVRRCVRAHRGRVIKTQGDSFMVANARPDRAVASAVAIQRALGACAADQPVQVRIGLHTGEVIARRRDLFGVSVALAARVAAEARGGEILVSDALRERLGEEVELGRPRTVRFKGISGAQRVAPVLWE